MSITGCYISFLRPKRIVSTSRRWLAIAGVSCLAAATVGGTLQLGDVVLPPVTAPQSQIIIGVAGAILAASSVISIQRVSAVLSAGLLSDPDFWLKVFNAMPPAFVKEYPSDAHIINNEACRAVQGEPPRHAIYPADAAYMIINADHRTGDFVAATAGASAQLELSEHVPTGYPQLILTTKTRIEHDGRVLIVGWYVPVDAASGVPPDGIDLEVRKCGEQILFPVPPNSRGDGNPFLISVGKAVRMAGQRRRGAREP